MPVYMLLRSISLGTDLLHIQNIILAGSFYICMFNNKYIYLCMISFRKRLKIILKLSIMQNTSKGACKQISLFKFLDTYLGACGSCSTVSQYFLYSLCDAMCLICI